ncbi:MAG: hypothetical protein R6X02_00410 [Enhygromyxa sp.]
MALAGTLVQVPPPPSGPSEAQPQPQPQQELSEEEKVEKAKQLYMQAEGLAAEARWLEAVPLYEEAYYLVPGKHGFAYKVGVAAWNARDCDKANEYLKHFIKYGDESKDADKFAEAKQILGEISVSGCATEDTTTTTTTTAVAEDDENPNIVSSTEERQQETRQERDRAKSEKRGLLLGGAVLLGVGVAGLGVGIAGLAVANSSAGSLRELSSNVTMSGFPEGDYACRGVPANECPSSLEGRMKTGNILGGVGLGIGGAALIGGAAMLAVYMVNKKKRGGASEAPPTESGVELSGLGPMLVPGGGAGAMAEIRF